MNHHLLIILFLRLGLLFLLFNLTPLSVHAQDYPMAQQVASEQAKIYQEIFIQPAQTQQKLIHRIHYSITAIPDTLRANEWNMLGICFAIQGKLDSALHCFDLSLNYLKPTDRQYGGFLVNKASVLRNMNRIEDAMVVLTHAEEVTKKQGDKIALSKVYGEMASSYSLIRNQELAIHYISRSIFLLQGSDSLSTRSRNIEKQKLANYFINESSWIQARDVLEEILPYFESNPQLQDKYYLSLLSYSECLLQLREWEQATQTLNNLLDGLEQFKNPYWIALTEMKLARLHAYLGKNDLADEWFQKAIQRAFAHPAHYSLTVCIEYLRFLNQNQQFKKAADLSTQISQSGILNFTPEWDQAIYFELLSESEAGLAHFDSAYHLLRKGKTLMDEITDSYNRTNLYLIQSHFENHLLQQQKQNLAQELKLKHSNLLATILALILCGSLLVYSVYTYRLRKNIHRKQIQMATAERQLLQEKLIFEEHASLKMSQIIESQKNEILGNALQMALLNDELTKFKDQLREGDPDLVQKMKDFNPGRKSLQILLDKLQLANPLFFDTLKTKFPHLSKADIEFCSMVEIGLSYKDIAALLQISHESAISKKYRITKKINLQGVEDFQAWLKEVTHPQHKA